MGCGCSFVPPFGPARSGKLKTKSDIDRAPALLDHPRACRCSKAQRRTGQRVNSETIVGTTYFKGRVAFLIVSTNSIENRRLAEMSIRRQQ